MNDSKSTPVSVPPIIWWLKIFLIVNAVVAAFVVTLTGGIGLMIVLSRSLFWLLGVPQ